MNVFGNNHFKYLVLKSRNLIIWPHAHDAAAKSVQYELYTAQ